jgi:transcriptional regulator with XRE-family HTH domain
MIGYELKEWRKERGYTLAQIGLLLGVSLTNISYWELGKWRIPPYLHLALSSIDNREKIKPSVMTSAELKQWRAQRGLTQTELGSLLGVGRQAVYYWESSGRKTKPYLCLALAHIEKERKSGLGKRINRAPM